MSLEKFHELYGQKHKYVTIANSYLQDWQQAEDIVADSFMFMFEEWKSIEPENPQAYFLGVVRHKCLDTIRRKEISLKVRDRIYDNIRREDLEMLADQDISHQLFSKDVMRIFKENLDRMPSLTAEVFKASRIRGMTHEEISKMMGISKRNVTYEISKAIKILRNSLGEYYSVVAAFLIASQFHNITQA